MKIFCPYRIAPLGAHIDHQYGVVCGASINIGIELVYNISDTDRFILTSSYYKSKIEISLNDLSRKNDWGDYFRGNLKYLLDNNYNIKKLIKCTFKAGLPPGGISSSSSSQIVFLKAVCNVNNIKLTEFQLIDAVYNTEKKYMNLSIGILDPSCEVLSKKHSLLFIDTLTKYYQIIENKEFSKKYEFIVIYPGFKRELINSKYNERVCELKSAYEKLDIENKKSFTLRDIPSYYYEKNKNKLNEVQSKRVIHYYSEMQRVKYGLQAWRNNEIITFGMLMNESCESSILNYECGSKSLIDLFKICKEVDGVLGSRFLGAGFNGSYLALIIKHKFKEIKKSILDAFLKRYPEVKNDIKILEVSLSNGIKC